MSITFARTRGPTRAFRLQRSLVIGRYYRNPVVYSTYCWGFVRVNSMYVVMCVCACVLSSHLFWTSDYTFRYNVWTHQPGSHRRKATPSAMLALIFIARRIQPSLSLVGREGYRILCTHDIIIVLHLLGMMGEKIPVRVTAPTFELTGQRQKVSRWPTEPPGRPYVRLTLSAQYRLTGYGCQCMVANPARGQLNREKCFLFSCLRSRLRIWSRGTDSAVPPCDGVHWYHQSPSGRSQVYRVTLLRTDGVHCRKSIGTGPVVLKAVPVTGAAFSGFTMNHDFMSSFPTPTIGI